jgi:hypothetical protein
VNLVHGLWTAAPLDHGEPTTMAIAVAYRSLAYPPLQAMAARRDGGNAKGAMQCDRGTTHQGLDGGEEVAHRRRDFGSKRLRQGHE